MGGRHRVAVVGAGAIGGRHAQAMARVGRPIDIDIVDPLPAARQRAVTLLSEASGRRDGSVQAFERLEDLGEVPDLAIVATNSRERPDAIRKLVAHGARALILEKVLFTRLRDHDEIDGLLAKAGVRAWVNCPRNAYPRAARLKQLVGGEPFHYRVEGQGWGLGCNLIHHLHEFSSLSQQDELTLDTSALEMSVPPSRRSGYVEFFGRVAAEMPGGTRLTAICTDGAPGLRTVTIDLGDRRLTLSPKQTLTIENAHGAETEAYPITPQSELTASYAIAIFNGGSPLLPDYPTASGLHRIMLDAFLQHLRRVHSDPTIDECPVT
ncbi:MAG: hypothetical protein QOF09_598 [Alphaproteobacteria bacterium]|jgi:hypothetical protein|nr:hypothetical protein [Alphaproteobacteria bacterium]